MKDRLGSAFLTLDKPVVAGSYASFDLVYTSGYFGIDDSGSIQIVQRFASDMGRPQNVDPSVENYVSFDVSGGAELKFSYNVKNNTRPWGKTLHLRVVNGFLREGDQIIVHYGDRRQGSPGIRMQTFCEKAFELKVLVDAFATCKYVEVPCTPTVAVIPGEPVKWSAVLPTKCLSGNKFRLCLKADDKWGNPSNRISDTVLLKPSHRIEGLPGEVTFHPGHFTRILENLSFKGEADIIVDVLDESGILLTRSNPLRIVEESDFLPFWGDMHGQSEETVGTNSARQYFQFGRDKAFLDVICHQGNDFQITRDFWSHLQELTEKFNDRGRFVAFPGYEWSGNTGLGGDHNVIFLREGESIRRSSHALIPDLSDADTDCHTVKELFKALKKRDVFFYAHAGGRYADLKQVEEHPPNIAIEIHSAWGTFEWLLHEAFQQGMRVGVVANSDGHKGRPGASYPGASTFGSYGGLTCFLCRKLSRKTIFESLKRRHHYATTGARMLLHAVSTANGKEAIMGDIASTGGCKARVRVEALCSAPIERIDFYNGCDLIETVKPWEHEVSSRRIRLVWEGAECRGRGRATTWDGFAELNGNSYERINAINFWNPIKNLIREHPNRVSWQSITTGGFSGFDGWLREPEVGELLLKTPHVHHRVPVSEIGYRDTVLEAGGLNRRVRIYRLPEVNQRYHVNLEREMLLRPGDNPLYIRLTQEDGHRAWSSPIYLISQ